VSLVTSALRLRRLPLVLTLVAVVGAAGCASGPGAQAAREPGPAAKVTVAQAAADRPLPRPCTLVDASDVGLYVALAEWRMSSSERGGRAVCRFDTNGFSVTTVTLRLPDRTSVPAGLCSPSGSRADPSPEAGLLCAYDGPVADSATAVVAAAGVAVGVRVTGPDAADKATMLAVHALSHL
jgi:hypothetical protein